MVKKPSTNAGDTDSISGLERYHMPDGNKALVPQLLSFPTESPCSATREPTTMRSLHTTVKEQ